MVEFFQADLAVHGEMLVDLNEEYLAWIAEKLRERYGIHATRTVRQTVQDSSTIFTDTSRHPPSQQGRLTS